VVRALYAVVSPLYAVLSPRQLWLSIQEGRTYIKGVSVTQSSHAASAFHP
jgi:hypothetical protein